MAMEYPLYGVCDHIKWIRGRAKPEGEALVDVVPTLPVNA